MQMTRRALTNGGHFNFDAVKLIRGRYARRGSTSFGLSPPSHKSIHFFFIIFFYQRESLGILRLDWGGGAADRISEFSSNSCGHPLSIINGRWLGAAVHVHSRFIHESSGSSRLGSSSRLLSTRRIWPGRVFATPPSRGSALCCCNDDALRAESLAEAGRVVIAFDPSVSRP